MAFNREEDLRILKEQVLNHENLTQEQKDLILSEIIEGGKTFDFGTGYATIDKPWQKCYNMDEYYKINNDKTIYQDIFERNQDYLNGLAIEYFLGKVSYKELFKNIEKASKSLSEYGVKKGDFVTICCAGIPELVYTVYALAKIGAVANLMAPYFDGKQMTDRISECESDTLIVMDKFYPQIKDSVKNSTIKKVIVIPTLNSSPLRILQTKKMQLDYSNELFWNQFIKDGKKHETPETMEYSKDYPLCMVYSSGTTGASKAIVLSHDSFQYSVLSYDANMFERNRGQKMYQIIPPWYSTGLSSSIHLPLHSGVTVFQDPRFERDVFVKNIIKHGIDYAIAPTSMYEGFLDEKLIKGKKLTHLGNPFEGGEPLTGKVKFQIEDNWKKMGCNSKLTAGYGQCECGATVTSPSQYFDHHVGSVALPIPGVIVSIFDDDNNELKYGERGNIYVCTPCGMLEYYKNPEATKEFFYVDEYGRKWSKTGDIGYMADNGDLFIEGRASDYTIVDGEKVYNFDIEPVIRELDDVSNCDSIARNNEDGTQSIGLHIIFKDEYKEKYADSDALINRLKEIQLILYEKLGDKKYVPSFFKIRDEFPYKPSGKRDIEKLGDEQDGFIFVNKEYVLDTNRLKKRI